MALPKLILHIPHKIEGLENWVGGSHKNEYSSFYHQNSCEEYWTSCSFHIPSQFPRMQPITMASKLYLHTTRQINYFIYLENNNGYPPQQQSHSKQNIWYRGWKCTKEYASPLSRIGLFWTLMQFLKLIVSGISLFATREFTLVQIVTYAFTWSGPM